MTQEEKAKAYDEALERARKINSGEGVAAPSGWTVCETIFPELAESKDERIRETLIYHYQGDGCLCTNKYRIDYKEIRAWLEKQGEQKFSDIYNKFIKMRETKPKDISEFLGRLNTVEQEFIWEHIAKIRELDKEEQKPFDYEKAHIQQNDFAHKSALEAIKEETVDNAYKVESKFKVGDWIIYDRHISKVKDMDSEGYLVEDTYGDEGVPPKEFAEKHYHLWTIADAKAGDVLATEPIEGYHSPFIAIYKKQNEEDFDSYCFIGFDGKFYKAENGHSTEKIHPATKEQRDLLFEEMHKAGYTFDFDKKELKKIEPADEVKPKFKHGDRVKNKKSGVTQILGSCIEDVYEGAFPFHIKEQDNWELVEQNTAWDEEDEYLLGETIQHLEELIRINKVKYYGVDVQYYQRDIDWLKSLKDRVQPNCAEWSGEDEKMLDVAIEYCDEIGHKKGIYTVSNWLRELKSRIKLIK